MGSFPGEGTIFLGDEIFWGGNVLRGNFPGGGGPDFSIGGFSRENLKGGINLWSNFPPAIKNFVSISSKFSTCLLPTFIRFLLRYWYHYLCFRPWGLAPFSGVPVPVLQQQLISYHLIFSVFRLAITLFVMYLVWCSVNCSNMPKKLKCVKLFSFDDVKHDNYSL